MKIKAISDLHGKLPVIESEFDVLCICGDIIPLEIQRKIGRCKEWLKEKFIPWCNDIKCKEVIFIGGNHDLILDLTEKEETQKLFENTKIHYLENEPITIDGVLFYGTPNCKKFGRWYFMNSEGELEHIYNKIPNNVDFLITHDAPYGTSDICMQDLPWVPKEHLGNRALKKAIIEKSPKYNLHGHLHSANHNEEILHNTKVYNVSLLDEEYNLVYSPLEIEYERESKETI